LCAMSAPLRDDRSICRTAGLRGISLFPTQSTPQASKPRERKARVRPAVPAKNSIANGLCSSCKVKFPTGKVQPKGADELAEEQGETVQGTMSEQGLAGTQGARAEVRGARGGLRNQGRLGKSGREEASDGARILLCGRSGGRMSQTVAGTLARQWALRTLSLRGGPSTRDEASKEQGL